MYSELNEFEKQLGNFADRVDIIVGLEMNDKLTQEQAYQQIKNLFKELKKLRKQDKK